MRRAPTVDTHTRWRHPEQLGSLTMLITVAIHRMARGWRLGLLAVVLLSFLALVSAEAWHRHDANVPEPQCALCQIAVHQPLDMQLSLGGLPLVLPHLLFVVDNWPSLTQIVSVEAATAYRSRAPPEAR